MKILLIYCYGHPDENVSAQHFSQLGAELAEKGAVTDFKKNWSCL